MLSAVLSGKMDLYAVSATKEGISSSKTAGKSRLMALKYREMILLEQVAPLLKVNYNRTPWCFLTGGGRVYVPNSIIKKLGPNLTTGILVPRQTTAGGYVDLAVKLTGRRRVTSIADVVIQTAVVRIAVAKGHKKVKGLLDGLSSNRSRGRGGQKGAGREHGEQHSEEKRLERTWELLATLIWKS